MQEMFRQRKSNHVGQEMKYNIWGEITYFGVRLCFIALIVWIGFVLTDMFVRIFNSYFDTILK